MAYRTGGGAAVHDLARTRSARQFDPELCALLLERADDLLADLDEVQTWESVIDGGAGAGPCAERGRARRRAAGDRRLRRPQVAVHPGSRPGRGRARRRRRTCARPARRRRGRTLRRAGARPRLRSPGRLERDLGQARTARAPASGSGCGCTRTSPSGCCAVAGARTAGCGRRPATRAAGRLGLPARPLRCRDLAARARLLAAADAYQAMREPRPHRPALTPEEAAAELRAEVRGRPSRRRRPSTPSSRRPVTACARRREGPAGLTAREVEVLRLLARGLSNKEIAAAPRHLTQDRRQSRRAHLRQDRRLEPRRRRACSRCSTGCCPSRGDGVNPPWNRWPSAPSVDRDGTRRSRDRR